MEGVGVAKAGAGGHWMMTLRRALLCTRAPGAHATDVRLEHRVVPQRNVEKLEAAATSGRAALRSTDPAAA